MYGDEIKKALVGRTIVGYTISKDRDEIALDLGGETLVVLQVEGD